MTHAEAAALVGCSRNVIDRAQRAGRISRRYPQGRKTPSLARASVEVFAEQWHAQQAAAAQARASRQRSGDLPPAGPPANGEVWLDSATSSLVVGVSPQYLGRLALQGRLAAARDRRFHKWWFRRSDIEELAAERAQRIFAGACG